MWGGLLLLSGLGSGGAWLRSYLKREEKANNFSLRDRLQTMTSEARKGASVDEIDKMLLEVDDIINDTLNCYDDGAIDQGDLAAFNLLLEQFRYTVADRKANLNNSSFETTRLRSR